MEAILARRPSAAARGKYCFAKARAEEGGRGEDAGGPDAVACRSIDD